MHAFNVIRILAFGTILVSSSMAYAQEPAYGMLFQPKAASVAPQSIQDEPLAVLKSRPVTQSDVDTAATNTQKPSFVPRTPSPTDLSRMPLSAVPSASPATFEQQQDARLSAWNAMEESRIERERQARLLQEAEAKKQVIVIQQQQQDDSLFSSLLAIPLPISIAHLF